MIIVLYYQLYVPIIEIKVFHTPLITKHLAMCYPLRLKAASEAEAQAIK